MPSPAPWRGSNLFLVDTNVFLYAAVPDVPEHSRCRARLRTWRGQPAAWFTSWPILYEFLRVVTHPQVFPRPWTASRAWSFVEAILASPGLRVLVEGQRHAEIARQTIAETPLLGGNLVHDFHTAVLMREHGVRRIYTRDMDFHHFSFIEVLDPLA